MTLGGFSQLTVKVAFSIFRKICQIRQVTLIILRYLNEWTESGEIAYNDMRNIFFDYFTNVS